MENTLNSHHATQTNSVNNEVSTAPTQESQANDSMQNTPALKADDTEAPKDSVEPVSENNKA
jgi:hypothetical protein